MTTVIVPLDGSTYAERALQPACSIAARSAGGRLLLFSCAPDDPDAVRQRLEDRARSFSRVVPTAVRLDDREDAAQAILDTVADEPHGVLCLATHGRRGVVSAVLGSVADAVVARSSGPVFLVGPRCRTALLPAELGRLLMCSDGSEFSDGVVAIASEWCDRLDLEPWLTEVVGPDEDPEPAHEPVPNREVAAAQDRLARLGRRLRSDGNVGTRVLHGIGDPGRSIADFAEELPAAVVAMATHGRTGLPRVTMGSVAGVVVRHAPCPVLVARPVGAAAPASR